MDELSSKSLCLVCITGGGEVWFGEQAFWDFCCLFCGGKLSAYNESSQKSHSNNSCYCEFKITHKQLTQGI